MTENPWDQQLVQFLKKAGDDLKKAGEEIRTEAQKLIEEVRDPATQQRVKDGLGNIGQWAKKAAEDAAGKIEEVVKKADEAWVQSRQPKRATKAKKKPRAAAKKATKRSAKGKRR
jgi:hypothetical protein